VSPTATASAGPAPTAIEPSRVLVLDDSEQRLLIETIETIFHAFAGDDSVPHASLRRLHDLIAYGEEYANPTDELVRTTLRKRRLEGEIRRCNAAIERTTEMVVEELADRGDSGGKHAATGASYRIDRKVWARIDVDVEGLPKDEADRRRAEAKAAAAAAMQANADLAVFVREDFNASTVSAYFREQIKAYDEEQRALPEHERAPRAAEDFLPDELRGLLKLDDTPTIQVRA
jgi:hypothetical protein